jgi:hypothetical protein
MAETIKSESFLAPVMIVAVTQGDPLYLLWLETVRIMGRGGVRQRWSNPGREVARWTEIYTMTPNICVSLVCGVHPVTIVALRNLRWLLDFCKICASVV